MDEVLPADADITPERLAQFINIAESGWIEEQLKAYEAFRKAYSPEGIWSHRPPEMSPLIPLIYWSSREPYIPTNEAPVGYWIGEPKSILGRLFAELMDFHDYWTGLPYERGLKNLRYCLRSPMRFASFEHELRTAATYKMRTPYEVEPCFLDARSNRGQPDIVLRKEGQHFNVQCKVMDPSASSTMPYELFQYLSGRLGRVCQDYNVHSILSVSLKGGCAKTVSKRDVEVIIGRVRKALDRGITTIDSLEFSKGEFTCTHRLGAIPLSERSTHLLTMFTGDYLFREVRNLPSLLQSEGLTSICQVSGVRIPPFENYVYPNAVEAAESAPKSNPLIICIHLYPPMDVHGLATNKITHDKLNADFHKFFDKNRHVCLVLVSSYAQQAFWAGGNKQTIATPAWEIESQHWQGERPDYYPYGVNY